MNFTQYLGYFIKKYNVYLEKESKKLEENAKIINPLSGEISVSISRLINGGGKRIRPALAYLGYWLATGSEPENENLENVFLLGTALEFLHTFALIHDDIIDMADMRRGKPTIETEYKPRFGIEGARTVAILAGDLLHVQANKLASQLPYPETKNDYFNMSIELVAGQIDDCLGVGIEDFQNVDEDRILAMLAAKSGNYSIQKPLLLGAKLAEEIHKLNQEEKVTALTNIGYKLGIIFQHTDDLLGIFGTEETGKSTNSDIVEGKRTLLMVRTVKNADDEIRTKLLNILGNKKATVEEINWVRETVKNLKIDQQLITEASEMMSLISTEIQEIWQEQQPGKILENLGSFLLNRKV